MILPRDGREYVTFTTSDSTGGTLTVSFDGTETWQPLEVVEPTLARCLIAGPDAASNPGGTVVLAVGTHEVLLRFVKDNEIVIRNAPENLTVV